MAYDKIVDSAALDAGLKQIADAIREKGGTSGSLAFPAAMAEAIAAIQSGGWKITKGQFRPTSAITIGKDCEFGIEHGLGEVPSFFAIMATNSTSAAKSLRAYIVRRVNMYSDYYIGCVQGNTAGLNSSYHYGNSATSGKLLTDTTVQIMGYNASSLLQTDNYYWVAGSNGEYF